MTRINFQVGDACALPFPDASFDHALSMLVLQFIPRGRSRGARDAPCHAPGGHRGRGRWDTRGGFVSYRMIFDTAAMLDSRGQRAPRPRLHQATDQAG